MNMKFIYYYTEHNIIITNTKPIPGILTPNMVLDNSSGIILSRELNRILIIQIVRLIGNHTNNPAKR